MQQLRDEFEKGHKKTGGLTAVLGSNLYDTLEEDRRKRYPLALGFDQIDGKEVDVVLDLELPLPEEYIGAFAHVDCLSVLEHSKRPWLIAANIEQMLDVGGTTVIAAPFVWRQHSYPNDYFRFTPEGLKSMFTKVRWIDCAFLHHTVDRRLRMTKQRSVHNVPMFERTEVALFGVRE